MTNRQTLIETWTEAMMAHLAVHREFCEPRVQASVDLLTDSEVDSFLAV